MVARNIWNPWLLVIIYVRSRRHPVAVFPLCISRRPLGLVGLSFLRGSVPPVSERAHRNGLLAQYGQYDDIGGGPVQASAHRSDPRGIERKQGCHLAAKLHRRIRRLIRLTRRPLVTAVFRSLVARVTLLDGREGKLSMTRTTFTGVRNSRLPAAANDSRRRPPIIFVRMRRRGRRHVR